MCASQDLSSPVITNQRRGEGEKGRGRRGEERRREEKRDGITRGEEGKEMRGVTDYIKIHQR